MASLKRKWSEQETVKFLELYEAEEVLWNTRLSDYKNKDARNAAILRIIDNLALELSPQDVNIKINNIRSTYSQEKSKIYKSKEAGPDAEVYVPTLAWYDVADRFLADVIKSRKPDQNMDPNNSDQNYSVGCSQGILPLICLPDIPASTSPNIAAPQYAFTSKRKRFKKPPQYPTSNFGPNNFGPNNFGPSNFGPPEAIRNQAMCSRDFEDEFSYFGRNVASQLRLLPLLDALDAQSDILNLIKEKRQANYSRESSVMQYNNNE